MPKERYEWDSLSVSCLEPSVSVKAAVIAQGPTGPEGLVVRAAKLSPIQSASNFSKRGEEEREGGGRDEPPFIKAGGGQKVDFQKYK